MRPPPPDFNSGRPQATSHRIRETLIAGLRAGGVKSVTGGRAGFCRARPGDWPHPRGRFFGESEAMSNLNDATGLRIQYGSTPQLCTEYEPASGTLWGYM